MSWGFGEAKGLVRIPCTYKPSILRNEREKIYKHKHESKCVFKWMVVLVSLLGRLSFLKYLYLQERQIWQSRAGESYCLGKITLFHIYLRNWVQWRPASPQGTVAVTRHLRAGFSEVTLVSGKKTHFILLQRKGGGLYQKELNTGR